MNCPRSTRGLVLTHLKHGERLVVKRDTLRICDAEKRALSDRCHQRHVCCRMNGQKQD